MSEFDRLKKQKDDILQRRRQAILDKFDDWWAESGRFYDPDNSSVSWFDKRRLLAQYAWSSAVKQAEGGDG